MTGPEHWREAERLIREVGPDHSDGTLLEIYASVILARAQVHATLAHTAAVIASGISVMKPTELGEWRRAMDPDYAAEVTR